MHAYTLTLHMYIDNACVHTYFAYVYEDCICIHIHCICIEGSVVMFTVNIKALPRLVKFLELQVS